MIPNREAGEGRVEGGLDGKTDISLFLSKVPSRRLGQYTEVLLP